MDEYYSRLMLYKKSNGEPLAQQTIKNYTNHIKTIQNDYKGDLSDYYNLKKYLLTRTLGTRINYLNALHNYSLIMGLDTGIQQIFKDERERYSREKLLTPMSDKKKEHLATWDDILLWRDLVIKKNNQLEQLGKDIPLDKLQLECLLRLYTTFQRRNEYADLIFYDDTMPKPDSDNTLFYDSKNDKMYLIFGEYKTKGKYGIQKLEITNTDKNLHIKTFLLSYIIKNNRNSIMFITRALGRATQPKQLTRTNLTKMLNRSSQEFLKKNISSDRIRKAYNSMKYGDVLPQLKIDSYNNAHSIKTIFNNYVV